jgi:hypothetical protein
LTTTITIIDNKNDLRIILLRRARFIELDTHFLCIKPPAAGDLPTVEVLSISGNIVDLGAFLNRWTRLRVLGVTSRRTGTHSLDTGLAALEAAAALSRLVSRLGIEFSVISNLNTKIRRTTLMAIALPPFYVPRRGSLRRSSSSTTTSTNTLIPNCSASAAPGPLR